MHARRKPVEHAFKYPVYVCAFDLDELEELEKKNLLFGYNRLRPVSLHDSDYLDQKPGSIREKVLRFIDEQSGSRSEIQRIELITTPRFLNYAFNPVSFYYCYDSTETLRCAVAEVNNTFGERHFYFLNQPKESKDGFLGHYASEKEFFVSPFFDRKGQYDFRFSDLKEKLDIRVDLYQNNECVLVSQLCGKPEAFTNFNLLKIILRFPLSVLLTIPRIHWQAAKLYFQKKLPIVPKPNPDHPITIITKNPNWIEWLCARILFHFISEIVVGRITFVMPNGERREFGEKNAAQSAEIRVKNARFFTRTLFNGDIGFGESYVDGDWYCDHLMSLISILIENEDDLKQHDTPFAKLTDFWNTLHHWMRKNSVENSKDNIGSHYDLSNDFFSAFLDPTMMYSCAYFKSPEETLEIGQRNKIRMIIEKAQIKSTDHVLEIGSGWGGFAIEAVKATGCRVTSITLSEQQLILARERVQSEGLQDQIEFKLCDYRHMGGKFDKIVSIEMLEAVGHEFLGEYFKACDRLLAPNGLIAIQAITIPDQRYDAYRKSCDWIQKHIFPGGHLPALSAICDALKTSSQLVVEDVENVGIHYARTLREWRERLSANKAKIKSLAFDLALERTWDYYFQYCEAAFATRYLSNLQLVLTRPRNHSLSLELESSYAKQNR